MTTSATTMLRQPKRAPGSVGGQFAGVVRTHVEVDLDDIAVDPWAEAEPTWHEQIAEDSAAVALASLATFRRSLEDDPERLAAHERADAAGGADLLAVDVGRRIAQAAHDRCGLTPESVAAAYDEAIAAPQAAYERAQADIADATAECYIRREDAIRAHGVDPDSGAAQTWLSTHPDGIAVKAAWNADYAENVEPLAAASSAAFATLNEIKPAAAERYAAAQRALTDAYLEVLAEVRPMGGDLSLSPTSTRQARQAFIEAAEIFPTEWIERSNARSLLHPRVTSKRAHYAAGTTVTKRVTAPAYDGWHHADEVASRTHEGRSTSPRYEYVPMTPAGRGTWTMEPLPPERELQPDHVYMHQPYDVDSRDVDGPPPRGRGWQVWTDPTDPTNRAWRRPRQASRKVSTSTRDEVTTNDTRSSLVGGRSGTFATSVHELSHRMESVVPGLTSLQAAFRDRRASSAGQFNLYPSSRGKREMAVDAGFPSAYTGKVYSHGHTEVLSTGVQALFGGDDGALAGARGHRADPEFAHFVLGTLASLGRTPRSQHST